MRILIVNTSERVGGAAVASNRLMAALNNSGVKAKMLVRDKQTDDMSVIPVGRRLWMRFCFVWERLCVLLHLRMQRQNLWQVDIANAGADITRMREFREADVIHLAWVNQGMLSLTDIRKIVQSGKRVVWTMHDLWPATAVCHYARECEAFKTHCHHCPLLPGGGSEQDLAYRQWERKHDVYGSGRIRFVACSNWLAEQARQSGLLAGQYVTSIPNPIDTHVFNAQDKREAKRALGLPEDKRVVLFVSQKVTDERKGAPYLVRALARLKNEHPALADDVVVALLGGHADELAQSIPLTVFPLGYVSGDRNLARVYNAADVFVLPSMEDNLPNTLMEALACGVPCVGFNVGGIPEMIDHKKNGYVAQQADENDLTAGLAWVLEHADAEALRSAALRKVAECYSQSSVAKKYMTVYEDNDNNLHV